MINPQIAPDPAGQFRPMMPVNDNRMGRQPIFEPVEIPYKSGDYDHLGFYGWTKEELWVEIKKGMDSGFVDNFDFEEFIAERKAQSRARQQI